jgi:hypothetical protein
MALLSTMGCAMCASPYDSSYAAFGGKVQRTNRACGRVSSILDPSAQTIEPASAETIVSPTPAAEQVVPPAGLSAPEAWSSEDTGGDLASPPTGEDTLPLPFESGEPSDAVPWEALPMPSELDPGAPLPDMDVAPGGY